MPPPIESTLLGALEESIGRPIPIAWLASRPIGWQTVHAVADRRVPAFTTATLRSLRLGGASLSESVVASAAESGEADVVQAVTPAIARMVASIEGWLNPQLMRVLVETGQALAAAASRDDSFRSSAEVAIKFDKTNPAAVEWAAQHSAELLADVSAEAARSVRSLVARAFERGWTPRELARRIKRTVGLTERQAMAVARVRDEILGGRPGSLVKAGKFRIRIPKGGASQAWARRRLDQYSSRLLSQRASLIAHTETITASTQGQNVLWQQARSEGLLSGNEVRVWITTPDDALCPSCLAMEGQEAGLDEKFFSGDYGEVDGPTLHPDCRCALGLELRRTRRR